MCKNKKHFWHQLLLLFVFHLYFLEKKNAIFNVFFFLAFYSFWLYGSGWPMFPGGTAHGLQHGWSGLRVWSPSPSYLCPGGAWGGGCWTRKYCIVNLSPTLLRLRGVGGRGRVFALPSWACVLSVLGTGVVISWEHGPQAPSVWLVSIFYWF